MSVDLVKVLHTHNVQPKTVLHVGAHVAQELHIYKGLGCAKGTFVEGDPETFTRLQEILSAEESFVAVQALLSDEDDSTVDFFIASNDGMSSSFLKPAPQLAIQHPELHFDHAPKPLQTKKLDSLGLGRFDLCVLDVQGAELKVLKGGMNTLQHSKAIMLEASIWSLYEGDSTVNELIAFLAPYGFSPVALHINSQGWGDCIFIKLIEN